LGFLAEFLFLRQGARWLARWGAPRLILVGVGAAALRYGLVAGVRVPLLLVLANLLHGLTYGAWFLGSMTLLEAASEPSRRGIVHGAFYACFIGLGPCLGGLFLGGAVARWGTAWTFLLMALFQILLIPLALCLFSREAGAVYLGE
jgi:PPP family 3-phenylpropionic acid transporter